jgi:hypothetical protein
MGSFAKSCEPVVLGLFVRFEFVDQPHSLSNYATDNFSNISARPVCQARDLILQFCVEIDWKPKICSSLRSLVRLYI